MIFLPTDLNKKNLNSVPGYGIHFSTVLKSKKEVRGKDVKRFLGLIKKLISIMGKRAPYQHLF